MTDSDGTAWSGNCKEEDIRSELEQAIKGLFGSDLFME